MNPSQIAHSQINESDHEPLYTCQRCDLEDLTTDQLCEHMNHDLCIGCCEDNESDYHFTQMKDDLD